MLKPSLIALALIVTTPVAAAAASNGSVVKTLRPQLRVFDASGQPQGQIKASDLKLPAPIVGFGAGNSVGVSVNGKTVYLRGLDVQTDKAGVSCQPVQMAARGKGTAYAASNMGLGGAADCKKGN
jgi:hypothetical protein